MNIHGVRPVLFASLVTLAVAVPQAASGQPRVALGWLATIGGGHVRSAGPIGEFGSEITGQRRGGEWRIGVTRVGVMTGCSGFCDLRDAVATEVGGGWRVRGGTDAGAWTSGFFAARVVERWDTPRGQVGVYGRRLWQWHRALVGTTEARLSATPIRGHGTQWGWQLRAGVGLARWSS